MKTNNELIAEFKYGKESWTVVNGIPGMSVSTAENQGIVLTNFSYDTSWNLLMSVIDKIRSEWGNDVILNGDLTVIKKTKGFKTKGFKKIEVLESGSIQSAYKAVLLYIEWYNKRPIKK